MRRLAGCYVRVSTERQTVENQRGAVERLAQARGYEVVWYEETESAVKQRPVLDRLLEDARTGKLAAIVMWALDRFQRSQVQTLVLVTELDRLGVEVITVQEQWLEMRGPTRQLLLGVFGWVAEQERARLIERTKAGLERARKHGKVLGRPVNADGPDPAGVAALRAAGRSWRQIAAQLGVPMTAVRRAAGRAVAEGVPESVGG